MHRQPFCRRLEVERLEGRTLLNAGTLDPTFGNDGRVFTDVPANDSASVTDMVLQADGNILVLGRTNAVVAGGSSRGRIRGAFDLFSDLALVRYNADGTLDTTFGNGGKVVADFAKQDTFTNLQIQPDGKILAYGGTDDFPPDQSFSFTALVRFNANGIPDTTFDADGRVQLGFFTQGSVQPVVQADGKNLVAAGGNTLARGESTRLQVAQGFTFGSEYRTLRLGEFYRFYLDRNADAGGLAGWQALLLQGGTLDQAAAGILGSPESLRRHRYADSDVTPYVQALFVNVLGRFIDERTASAYVGQLPSNTPPSGVARDLLRSAEATTNAVYALYATHLRRTPEEAGLTLYTDLLQRGVGRELLDAAFVSAPEYTGGL